MSGAGTEGRISVVIPAYGAGPYLSDLIRALAAQSHAPDEIIVAHSGDHDPTGTIEALAPRVRVLHSETRWLPGAARNAGAAAAKGDWLAFIDSDMQPAPDWLAGLVGAAAGGGPDDMTIGAIDRAPDETYWGTVMWYIEFGSVHPTRPAHDMAAGPGANLLIRRKTFAALGGFPEDLLIAEDAAFCVRLREKGGHVRFTPEAVSVHHFQCDRHHALSRLRALGAGGAAARQELDLPGSFVARTPPLGIVLLPVRVAQMVVRLVSDRAPMGAFIRHFPGIALGLAAWTWGFTRRSFARPAGGRL